jgi:hypothetical protein
MKKLQIPPALALFLLSPAIGELLSGSSPPLEFFNPFSFLLLASLYGSGAVLIRELKTHWHRDYRGLLLLGAAYGILEEGLMVKSFFDPNWMDLGILGSFGRWMDVNWVWAEMLIIYHAVFSITIPIILIELAYPEKKDYRWISKRWFALLVLVLATVTGIGYFFLTQYRPPMPQYLLAALAMTLFIYAAYKLPPKKTDTSITKTGSARRLFIISGAASFAFFLLFYSGPYIISNPIIIMLFGTVFILWAAWYVNRFEWKHPQSAMNRLSIASGGLAFMIFLAFLMEFRGITGMSVVSLSAVVLLLLLRRKIKRTRARAIHESMVNRAR